MILEEFKEHFNNKNIEKMLKLFTTDIKVDELNVEDNSFQTIEELRSVYNSLFEINPNVKCELLESINGDDHTVGIYHFYDFKCGAESKTVWNSTLKDGKIAHILHYSEHKPGQ